MFESDIIGPNGVDSIIFFVSLFHVRLVYGFDCLGLFLGQFINNVLLDPLRFGRLRFRYGSCLGHPAFLLGHPAVSENAENTLMGIFGYK